MNPKVSAYISKLKQWKEETEKLRKIILASGLSEELKWGKPCYSFNNTNLLVIQGFKEYFALLFFKGVLLKDPHHILTKTGENTRVGRQVRFANVTEITKLAPILKAYIQEAIEAEKAGLQVLRLTSESVKADLPYPEEFQKKLAKMPALKKSFAALTPGRQKAYLMYFTAAKQSTTREARVEKCLHKILSGKGLLD